jgi:DNA-binding LacI/PurR family transcriptional regulator
VAVTDSVSALTSVVVDDLQGARMQAEYLAEKGHRRVAHLHSKKPTVSCLRRQSAFMERAAQLSIAAESYPCSASNEETIQEEEVFWLDHIAERGVTAVACWNDLTAFDMLEICRKRSLHVPQDLAIIGFDGVAQQRGFCRRLTTIQAPWREVAVTAVEEIMKKINGERDVREIVLPVTLLPGDTA